jgi:hypothetical protein
VIDLEQAISIVQSQLDVYNHAHARFNTGGEVLVARELIEDLEYGWYIGFACRGELEGWTGGSWKLRGGSGPFVVLRGQGEVFHPSEYSLNHLAPWWKHILDFEQNALGVIRIDGIIHPTLKYIGQPDLSFLPAFRELEIMT